jgi:molybdenum cofactor cytidylyltransferase
MKVAAVILAAGASTRLGEPKQLVTLGGERLLERAARVATEAGCDPVLVVLGSNAAAIREQCFLPGATIVVNIDWREGMASSIRAGVRALPAGLAGIVLMTCDQPAVTSVHLRALIGAGDLAASRYAGRRGVPSFIPAARMSELERLQGDVGAREMLQQAQAYDLPFGELDVDSVEMLEHVRRVFGAQS